MYPLKIRHIIKVIGILLIIEALFMLTALPFSYYYGGEDALPILESSLITAIFGLMLWFVRRSYNQREIGLREGYIVVFLTWIIISVFGALPYYLGHFIPSYTDAYFETMSGFSTTGASILTDIESLPKGILFWRSTTHWIGGMGIIVLTVAILPLLGFGGMSLFKAEVSGVEKGKLHPRVAHTARNLWGIYAGLTLILVVLLMFGGMDLFNAICHAFGTMATGGFSPKNTSIAEYSPYIQYIITLFMIIAGVSFTLHFYALKGKLLKAYKGVEFKSYILIILIPTIVIAYSLVTSKNYSLEPAIRSALFQVSSIITCTGFATDDYMLWPSQSWFIIFILMFIGGMAGSTAGGIKVIRWVVLFKNLKVSLNQLVHPSGVFRVKIDGRPLQPNNVHNVFAMFVIYLLTFAIGSLAITALGLDVISATGSVASCMGGIGPGLNSTGPVANYAHLSDLSKWILALLMLIGRLEIFTVMVITTSAFWKK